MWYFGWILCLALVCGLTIFVAIRHEMRSADRHDDGSSQRAHRQDYGHS